LFPQGGDPIGLELVESSVSGTGVAIHTYRRTQPQDLS
jgi:hypothetical protein